MFTLFNISVKGARLLREGASAWDFWSWEAFGRGNGLRSLSVISPIHPNPGLIGANNINNYHSLAISVDSTRRQP